MTDPIIRYYVTKNRLSPFAALYGYWSRGNFQKVCLAGCSLYHRKATPEEVKAYANNQRELGFSYPNITAMVREVSCVEGPEGRKRFMASIRYHRNSIELCLKAGNKKREKFEQKKAAQRQRKKEADLRKKEEARKNLPSNIKAQLPLFDAPLILKKIEPNKPIKQSKTKKQAYQPSLF